MEPPIDEPRDLDTAWNACDAPGWNKLLTGARRSSLEQSWAYGEALAAAGLGVERGVVSVDGEPAAAVQAFTRRVSVLGRLVRITRGPVWLRPDLDVAERAAILSAIRGRWRLARRELALWMPELPDGPEAERLMRGCGMRRMVTGYTTSWIDVTRTEDALRAALHGKWRNKLRAAERGRLAVDAATGTGPALDWLLERYAEFRRRRRFLGPDPELIRSFARVARRADVVVLRARLRREPVAGVLFLRHGASATYYVGWTGDEGRRRRAHNLLLWRGLGTLAEAGTAWLDLGGINPAAPGVARFKLGMGGEVTTLAGTYL